ncbi:hypothetical protein AAF712_002541 [Marasmius tenuissimus]|uniref:Uncharacterized protein n=1 Tax=Marasmius tenuissimus TaxID=585030 RepID=A0ABR3ABG5_9AGAR
MSPTLTATSALDQIRKLGKQPSVVHINNPSKKVQLAVQSLTFLGQLMRTPEQAATWAQVRARWSNVVEPWISCILQKVLLASEEPISPEGVAIFDGALTHIPEILSYPSLECENLLKPLQKTLVQIWMKAITIGHASWGGWSTVAGTATTGIIKSPLAPPVPLPTTSPQTAEDIRLGSTLIQHFNTVARRLPEMDGRELNQVLFYLALMDAPSACFSGVKPNLRLGNGDAFFLCLLSILRTLALRKRVVNTTDSQQHAVVESMSHDLFSLTSLLVRELMLSPHRALVALENGIIDVIFKLPPVHFILCDERRVHFKEGIVQNLCGILATISRFLVNQAVLRGAVRKINKAAWVDGMDERLKRNSVEVWEAWLVMQSKAYGFYTVRCAVWTQFCGNPKVSRR